MGIDFSVGAGEAELLGLYSAAFGKQFSPEWLRWWCQQSPTGRNRIYGAVAGDQLVGAYGLLPFALKWGAAYRQASLCTNVCVHPSAQGKGLFTELGKYALSNDPASISIGFPNPKALPGHRKVGGWREVEVDTLSCSPHAFANDCAGVDLAPGWVGELAFEQALRHSFMVVRNAAWLNWRYFARPGSAYAMRTFGERGYVVLKVYGNKAHVVDYLASDDEAMGQVMAAAETYAAMHGCTSLTMWSTEMNAWRGTLHSMGWGETCATDTLIVRSNDSTPLDLDFRRPWHVAYGDNDVY